MEHQTEGTTRLCITAEAKGGYQIRLRDMTSALPVFDVLNKKQKRSQGLSKYQVAEEICCEENVYFHSDDKSHDQNHILDRQVNLPSGKPLYLG